MRRSNAGAFAYPLVLLVTAMPARGQDDAHMSRAALKHLMARANEQADYERLSTFFHSQEESHRAKAQAEMDDYADCVRNFITPPKFPTRADQDFRLFQYYSEKADNDAKLAEIYDRKLVTLGIKPVQAAKVVSVKDLQRAASITSVNALDSNSQHRPPPNKP